MTPHQLLDLISYQLAALRKATPEQLAGVLDDLTEAEALLGPAAEHVEQAAAPPGQTVQAWQQTQPQQPHPRQQPAERTQLTFLPGVRDVA